MKLTRKFISLLVIVLLSFSNAVKITSKTNLTTDVDPVKKTDQTPTSSTGRPATYIDLVTTPNRPKCPIILDPKAALRDAKKIETGTFPAQGPYVQACPFKMMNTKDTAYINYVFDFLDEMIIKKENNSKLNILLRKRFSY